MEKMGRYSEIRMNTTTIPMMMRMAGSMRARAAVRAVARFSFQRLGLHRVEAACIPTNEPSRGVLLKAGFTQEGLARAYLRINGIWQDHLLFGLISPAPASEHRGEDVLV